MKPLPSSTTRAFGHFARLDRADRWREGRSRERARALRERKIFRMIAELDPATVLHHPLDLLRVGDVAQGIAADDDEIGEVAGADRADLGGPARLVLALQDLG